MSDTGAILKSVNEAVSLAGMTEGLGTVAREMEKAGFIEEVIGDKLEEIGTEIEDEEVDRVLRELVGGGEEPKAEAAAETDRVEKEIPKVGDVVSVEEDEEDEEEEQQEMNVMRNRLQAL